MELAKVTSKGQITIPLMIRNLLNLKTGDKVFLKKTMEKSTLQMLLKSHFQIFKHKYKAKQKRLALIQKKILLLT